MCKQDSVEEGQEREQQCRDQVDMGLMRMERLKEESTAAAAASSPPASFAGSIGALPTAGLTQVCKMFILFCHLTRPTFEFGSEGRVFGPWLYGGMQEVPSLRQRCEHDVFETKKG